MPEITEPGSSARRFATTRWSLVIAANAKDTPHSGAALEELCRTYWYPLYGYARRRGYNPVAAQDLTQEFFARALDKDYFGPAAPELGRFRSFLVTLFQRFLSHERERDQAQKRGGGQPVLSIDFELGERRLQLEPVTDWTPEREYERRWALTLLAQVLDRLANEYAAKGKEVLFSRLRVFLTGDGGPSHESLAQDLKMTVGAVKVAAHRLRQRYGELLREEIARTVANDDEINDELRCLLAAVRGH